MTTFRQITSEIFNEDRVLTRRSRLINSALFILIFSNVVMIVLESVPSIEQEHYHFFRVFELVSVLIFTMEYFARLWSCVDNEKHKHESGNLRARLRYMRSPMAIIDLIVILPFYLTFFFVLDLRFLRILRLLRIFKLTRYSAAMKTLLSVLKNETPALFASYVIMFTIVVLASSGIYLLEHDIQPEHFGNIPVAMWWAVVTLTTVGYGDVTPITMGGKIFGGLITLVGISMVALPTGIIASGFGSEFRRKRQTYQLKMEESFADGGLSKKEKEHLKSMQETLGLSAEDAKQIYKETLSIHLQKH